MSANSLPSRQEVEDLLYREAALLDEWRLEEWLEMLTDDAIYQVPSTDAPEATRAIRCTLSPTMPYASDRASSSFSASPHGRKIHIPARAG